MQTHKNKKKLRIHLYKSLGKWINANKIYMVTATARSDNKFIFQFTKKNNISFAIYTFTGYTYHTYKYGPRLK